MENQLIKIEALDPKEVFTGEQPTIKNLVQQVKDEVKDFKADPSTEEGRQEIKSLAYKITRSKTALDDMGKDFNSEMRDFISGVNIHRNYAKDELEALAKEIRKPLTEWEDEEARKEQELQNRFLCLKKYEEHSDLDLPELRVSLEGIKDTVIDETWLYLEAKAKSLKEELINVFTSRIVEREQYESDMAELEASRKDKADREAKEAAAKVESERQVREQQIAKDAAQKAEQEAEAAKEQAAQAEQRRIKDLADAAEEAERDKQRAIKEEQDRVERDKKEAEAEQTRLANNKKHNHKIHTEAKEALIVAGLSDQAATQAVTAIYKNMIPHISIRY